MKKLLILAILLPLAGCDWFGSDNDKKSPPVVVQPNNPTPPAETPKEEPPEEQPSDPVTPEEPPVEEEPVNETREEMIERELNLPPEPDETENNATILGVDVNENNIRDDVERKIAFEFYDDKPNMKRLMRYAQTWNEIFNANGDQSEVLRLLKERSLNNGCKTIGIENREEFYNAINNSYDPDDLLTNSFERRRAYLQATKSIRGLRLPTDEEVRTYCSQFNN